MVRIIPILAVAGYDPQDTTGNSYSYEPGVEVDVPDHIADDLVTHGMATRVVDTTAETATVKPKAETRKK